MDAALDFQTFRNIADETTRKNPTEGVLLLEDRFKKLIFGSDYVANAMNSELARTIRDPLYVSGEAEPYGLPLGKGNLWQMSLERQRRSSENLYTTPYALLIGVLGPSALEVDHYTHNVEETELFRSDLKLVYTGSKIYDPGDVFQINPKRDVLDLRVEALGKKKVVLVKLSSVVSEPFQWAFSRETLQPLQAISSSQVDSVLVLMARVIGAMEAAQALPALEMLSGHSRHFVRWASLRAMARIHPEMALEKLTLVAADDPHVELRQSAAKALEKLRRQG